MGNLKFTVAAVWRTQILVLQTKLKQIPVLINTIYISKHTLAAAAILARDVERCSPLHQIIRNKTMLLKHSLDCTIHGTEQSWIDEELFRL